PGAGGWVMRRANWSSATVAPPSARSSASLRCSRVRGSDVRFSSMLRILLWPASILFQGIALVRAWLYNTGRLRPRRLGGRVLSVGNWTVGGTGKTPMVLWLADRLQGEGKRIAILTRGYPSRGRSEERGMVLSDEVALLRNRLGGKVQFGVGRNRY